MKDFDGVDIFQKIENEIDALLNNLALRYVTQLSSNSNKKVYICYAINGKRFKLSEKETDDIIFKRACKENVSAFKKYLAKKWNDEEDKNNDT